jgi:flagellar assembly protein FliH
MAANPSPFGLFTRDFDELDVGARARPVVPGGIHGGVIMLDDPDPAEAAAATPPVTAEMLAAACAEAHALGLGEGRAAAAAAQEAERRALLAAVLDRLGDAADQLRLAVDETGGALARLVLASVSAALPALCARHGAAELARFTAEVTALLAAEPRIVIRVHPAMAPALEDWLAGLEPERRAAVLVEPRDSLAPGDARIAWRHGMAVRDAASLPAKLAEILGPLGLAPEPAATPALVAHQAA